MFVVHAVIGVPLLLAYVYGVVPLSLCRSVGSCGIRTVSAGVRINVNDEEECPTPGSLSVGPFQSTSNVGSSLITISSLDGTVIESLFSAICPAVSIYLSMSVCTLNFRCCKLLGNSLTSGVAYLRIAYCHTAGVCNIFPNTWCRCR